ncbi:MAG: substrate-binding domain-containing protein [Planctomycetota bacterium]
MTILTLMNCVHDYGRRALEGIARYGNAHGGWTLSLNHEEQVRQAMPKMEPSVRGIVAHAYSKKLLTALTSCGVPVVNTSSVAADVHLPCVLTDNDAIGTMAAEYMISRGFRRLMALELAPWMHSVERAQAFRRVADRANVEVNTVAISSWKRAETTIRAALEDAPTPLGCFAGSDGLAVLAVRQSLRLGLAIPEQIAVLGVDNDTLTTRMMVPTISSIELPWEKLGFEAASRLDQLIRGEPVESEPLRIAPTYVVTRQSTSGTAIEDREVAEVLRYIREHASQPLTVAAAIQHVPASRRAIEQRFKKAVGRTLQQHITAVRLELSKRFLAETDYSMPEVATRSGFAEPAYFSNVFRKHIGQTPGEFRQRHRLT